MKVLGIWGVFVIAFADSALLGMPVDFIVASYVYQDRHRMLLYVAMASLGSAVGSIPLYLIGYAGGEKVLRKRISEERFQKIHESFERNEFWALMFPGMLPPPMPFKVFVLAAAVFLCGPLRSLSDALNPGALVRAPDHQSFRRHLQTALAAAFRRNSRTRVDCLAFRIENKKKIGEILTEGYRRRKMILCPRYIC